MAYIVVGVPFAIKGLRGFRGFECFESFTGFLGTPAGFTRSCQGVCVYGFVSPQLFWTLSRVHRVLWAFKGFGVEGFGLGLGMSWACLTKVEKVAQ